MHIAPCNRCPIGPSCVLRAEIKRKVRNLGAVSVRFRCAVLASELRVGRRITISVPVLVAPKSSYIEEPDLRIERKLVPATITYAGRDHRFGCIVDADVIPPDVNAESSDTNAKRRRKRQSHTRIIELRDEPDHKMCENGCVVTTGECDSPNGPCECAAIKREMELA